MDQETFDLTLERQDGLRFTADFHQAGMPTLLLDECHHSARGAGQTRLACLGPRLATV